MAGRRQEYIKNGRPHEHRVLVTGEQELALKERADALGVTIPKLLVDTALGAPVVEQRAIFMEMAGLRRKFDEVHRCIKGEADNVNMIARAANEGLVDPEELRELHREISWRNEELVRLFSSWAP